MKAEKAFRAYAFLSWLDEFTQVREGRSNLPPRKINTPEGSADDDSIHAEDSILAEIFGDLPETEKIEKNPAKNNRKRKLLQGATKESYLEKKEFAFNNIFTGRCCRKTTKKAEKKEQKSAEELFCSSLAAELKELPE